MVRLTFARLALRCALRCSIFSVHFLLVGCGFSWYDNRIKWCWSTDRLLGFPHFFSTGHYYFPAADDQRPARDRSAPLAHGAAPIPIISGHSLVVDAQVVSEQANSSLARLVRDSGAGLRAEAGASAALALLHRLREAHAALQQPTASCGVNNETLSGAPNESDEPLGAGGRRGERWQPWQPVDYWPARARWWRPECNLREPAVRVLKSIARHPNLNARIRTDERAVQRSTCGQVAAVYFDILWWYILADISKYTVPSDHSYYIYKIWAN